MSKRQINLLLNVIIYTGLIVMIGLPLMLVLPGVPAIWYRIDASAVDKEADYLTRDLGATPESIKNSGKQFIPRNLPDFDPALPAQNRVRIPVIGVDGLIYEGADAKRTLTKGIWRTYNFGTPDIVDSPTILASHRYGNPNWTNQFRDTEIFFNLDKVKVGDEVQIVWGQRLYRYRVYKTDVGTQPTDISFDVLLYTCNFWNSPDRIYVYAARV